MKQEVIPTHQFYDRLERSIPFDIIELKEKSAYDPSAYHRHAYYEIFFIIKGGGTHSIDFEKFDVDSNSIHFVSPGQVHLLKRALKSNGFVVLFSREFYQLGLQNKDTLYEMPFLNNNTTKPIVKLTSESAGSFKELFERIKKENASSNKEKEHVLWAYLNLLLLDSKRIFEAHTNTGKEKSSPRSEISQKFKILIEKHFFQLHKPSEYADILNITPGHLNDTIKISTGMSAGDMIQERIILEIKRMLLHSPESINEIARIFNFDDPSYFARFFKNKTGSSPKDFREESRRNYK